VQFSCSYQPRTLDDVIGQPAVVRRLKLLVTTPRPCYLLFHGPAGVGKTATAKALAQDLGVCPFSGFTECRASNLDVDEVRRLFGQTFRYKPMAGNPWHVLLIEELELIVSRHVNVALKDELGEQHMPERLIVVATSNDASGLDEALLQRFDVFPFSAGPTFAEACQERLAWIWQQEAGPAVPMPLGMEQMGWRNGSYSMRRAMTALGGALELRCGGGVAA
jgi:replication-associated recombination protein RarA